MSAPQSYAIHSILLAYALALLPFYYSNLRMIYATGGKWPLAMPRTNMQALKPHVPANLWNQSYRARCAHENALEGFPFFAAAMSAGTISNMPAEELNKAAAQYLGLRVPYTVLYIGIESQLFSLARSVVWGLSLMIPGIVIWRAGCVGLGEGK